MGRKRNAKPGLPPVGGYECEIVELGPAVYFTPPPEVKARGGLIPAGDGEGLPERPPPGDTPTARSQPTLRAKSGPGETHPRRTEVPLIPTWEEIGALPRWARVALVARCVRRVLPAFTAVWTGSSETRAAVRLAVDAVERCAAKASASEETVFAIDTVDLLAVPLARDTERSIITAARAARRVLSAPGDHTNTALGDVARVLVRTATIHAPLSAQLKCIRRDFARLKRLAREQNWTDETPVPPEVFGPLWPPGVEPDWAINPPPPTESDQAGGGTS